MGKAWNGERWKSYGFCCLIFTCVYVAIRLFDTDKIVEEPRLQRNGANMKEIVFWTSWFNDYNWEHMMGKRKEMVIDCPEKCVVSTLRRYPLSFNALIFHGWAWQWPSAERTPDQVYIMFFHESPRMYHKYFIKGNSFYNWSVTYDRRSDIWAPYYRFRRKVEGNSTRPVPLNLPQMSYVRTSSEAMVFWVVSNCHAYSKREKYVSILQDYIKVDVYGKCGKYCNKSCHPDLAKSGRYKFYLAFENSACRDYITEKLFTSLRNGMVPVVFGGLHGNDYVETLPHNSFIDVRKFTSPIKLAEYLIYLDNNDSAYLEYHAWKKDYEIEPGHVMCDICRALYNASMTRPRNVDWGTFWNPDTECDPKLLEKVISS